MMMIPVEMRIQTNKAEERLGSQYGAIALLNEYVVMVRSMRAVCQ